MNTFQQTSAVLPLWEDFIYSGNNQRETVLSLRQLFFINSFSLIGFLSVILFGVLHLDDQSYFIGFSEVFGGCIFLLNLLVLRRTGNIVLAKIVLLSIQACLLLLQLITGGTEQTGIYWYFTFPIAAFFLLGQKMGMLWTVCLSIFTLFLYDLSLFHIISVVYTFVEVRQLLISLLVVGALVYIYQHAIDEALALKKELDFTKSDFVTLASHQLRTPISAIGWFSEMLLHGDAGPITAEQKDHIAQIYQSNKRMSFLVSRLLQISQLETASFPVTEEQIQIRDMSHSVLQEEIEKYDVKELPHIEEHYDVHIAEIFADPVVLKIIFQNLFSNAIKYTPPGGTVTITIVPSGQYHLAGAKNKKEGLLIIVSDTGYGIPKNEKQKIFTKFYRAENIRNKDTDGTGLGLYLVSLLMRHIKGEVWFQANEPKGTIFFAWIPGKEKN